MKKTRRHPLSGILLGLGALSAASFVLSGISVFLGASSWEAVRRLPLAMEPRPLTNWDQIQSADLAVYAGNLRALGCPERAIKALLFGNADAARLPAMGADLSQARAESPVAEATPKAKSQSDHTAKSAGNGGSDDSVIVAPVGNVSIPMVFQSVGPSLKLNEQQKAQWSSLQQDFVDQIGGGGQDPSDAAYRARWEAAQDLIDQRFKALFGQEVFNMEQAQISVDTDGTSAR